MSKADNKAIDIAKYKDQDIFKVDTLVELIKKYEPYVIDVRSMTEYCSCHICGAHNINTPLPPLYPSDVRRLEKKLSEICVRGRDSLIIVYCKLGKRAGLAKRLLIKMGYSNVLSLGGVDENPLKKIMEGGNGGKIRLCQCCR